MAIFSVVFQLRDPGGEISTTSARAFRGCSESRAVCRNGLGLLHFRFAGTAAGLSGAGGHAGGQILSQRPSVSLEFCNSLIVRMVGLEVNLNFLVGKDLTSQSVKLKYRQFPANSPEHRQAERDRRGL
jgi:hypothetical protein